jgi:hypothetical protein
MQHFGDRCPMRSSSTQSGDISAAAAPRRTASRAVASVAVVMSALVAPSAVSAIPPAEGDPFAESSATRRSAGEGSLPAAAAAAKKRWLFGRLSHTYEESPVTGATYVSTIEQVGYKGKRDASWPRVGDVYLGSIWVGRSGDGSAGDEVVTEVMLPAKTRFAISRTHRVRCYTGDADGAQREIRGRKCPNRPIRGAYGWEFSPPKGSWDVPSRHWVQIIFPLRSARPLKGLVGARNGCLVGAVKNLSGWRIGRLWDAPVGRETCPNADGHGPYQGVFVARRR